jgi:hypothetical protein
MPDELREDARLTDTPRDQLAVLAAEIEDENRALLGNDFRARELYDVANVSAGSWGRLS